MIRGLTEEEAIEMLRGAGPGDVFISLIGGNQYNTLGLLEHPQPFDFMITPEDAGSLTPDSRIIPLAQIDAMFTSYLRGRLLQSVSVLRAAFRGEAYCLETPPPKADADFIRRNAESHFRVDGEVVINISPAPFRRRLWQAQSRMMRRLCDEQAMSFLPTPPSALDSSGYLATSCYGADATHANAAYGELVLQDLENKFAQDALIEAVS